MIHLLLTAGRYKDSQESLARHSTFCGLWDHKKTKMNIEGLAGTFRAILLKFYSLTADLGHDAIPDKVLFKLE